MLAEAAQRRLHLARALADLDAGREPCTTSRRPSEHARHRLRALAHRNYRLFFVGQLVSLVGTWMQQVAQAWLVLQLTGDPFLLGLAATVQFLPVMVLGLFGGLIADALPSGAR